MDFLHTAFCHPADDFLAYLCSDGRLNWIFTLTVIPFLGIVFAVVVTIASSLRTVKAAFIQVPFFSFLAVAIAFVAWLVLVVVIGFFVVSEGLRWLLVGALALTLLGFVIFFIVYLTERNRASWKPEPEEERSGEWVTNNPFDPPTSEIRGDSASFRKPDESDERDS